MSVCSSFVIVVLMISVRFMILVLSLIAARLLRCCVLCANGWDIVYLLFVLTWTGGGWLIDNENEI